MRLELSLIDMAVVFGAPCICRGALQSLTNATILPHLLKALTGHQLQQLKRSLTWKSQIQQPTHSQFPKKYLHHAHTWVKIYI